MTQTSTATQMTLTEAYAYRANLGRCGHAATTWPMEYRGEGMDSKAHCLICGSYCPGIAAERDLRPNGRVAAYAAYLTGPIATAALDGIRNRCAKRRIKLGSDLGRRRTFAY